MPTLYGASPTSDPGSEAMPGTRDARTMEVGGRLAQAFRDGGLGLDTQAGTKRAGFKTGDIPMPASDKFPRINDIVPLKPRAKADAKPSTEDKKLYSRLAAIIGFSTKDGLGNTYAVIKLAGAVAIKRTAADGAMSTVMPNTPDWTRAAILLLNAHKRASASSPRTQKGAFKSSGRSGSTTDTASQPATSGSSAPAWASQPYIAEITALAGFSGVSATTPGVAYAVKMVDLGGYQAPAIDVASGGGTTGGTSTTATVTPDGSTWVAAALEVFAAKSAADAGIAPPAYGPAGALTVTGEQTGSEGSVWLSEGVPSSDAALADQAQQTVNAALSEDGTTVSSTFASTGAGALAKYKWLILAGVGVAGFVYARKQGWIK